MYDQGWSLEELQHWLDIFLWRTKKTMKKFITVAHAWGKYYFSWRPALAPHTPRALTRPYRGRLTAPSQLKLVEYFPPIPIGSSQTSIKLKNKYYWFFVHTCGYKLYTVWLWSFIDYNTALKLLDLLIL